MPTKAKVPCGYPGCPMLVPANTGKRCDEHRVLERRRYDQSRGTTAQRGYGARWQKLRKWYVARHPLCAHPDCGAIATEVDHIIPRAKGGLDAEDNLQGLCKRHHSAKTSREDSWNR